MNELVTITKNEDENSIIKYCIIFNEFPQYIVFIHEADIADINMALVNESLDVVDVELYCIKDMSDDFFYTLHINDDFTCIVNKCEVETYISDCLESSIIESIDLGKEYGYEIFNKFKEIFNNE